MKLSRLDAIFILSSAWFLVWTAFAGQYRNFGDEMEVITGGWFINRGLLPYRDFFFHKMPLMYYLSGIAYFLGLHTVVKLRIFLASIYLLLWVGAYNLSSRLMKTTIIFFLLVAPFYGTIFLQPMWLVNTLAGYALVILFILLFQANLNRRRTWSKNQEIMVVILVFLVCNTSLTAILALLPLLVVFALHNFRQRRTVWLLLIMSNAILPVYFALAGVFKNFWWANVVFSQHYFLAREGESEEIAFGRFGFFYRILRQFWGYFVKQADVVISELKHFWQASVFFDPWLNYQTTRPSTLKIFLMTYPKYIGDVIYNLFHNLDRLEIALFLIMVIFFVYLITERMYRWLIITIVFMIGLRARSNEIFQLAPYYIFILWTGIYLMVVFLHRSFGIRYAGRIIMGWLLAVIIFISVGKYRQIINEKIPSIDTMAVDTANQVAPMTSPDDRIWMWGGWPEIYFVSQRLPSNPYYFYFPVLHSSDKIKEDVERDLESGHPKLIVFVDHTIWFSDKPHYYAKDLITVASRHYCVKNDILLRAKDDENCDYHNSL